MKKIFALLTCILLAMLCLVACDEKGTAQTACEKNGHTIAVDPAVEATCTASGKTEGKHCSVCNEVLVEQETVMAIGHTPITDPAKAPTCATTGLTEGSHCSVCGEVLIKQEPVGIKAGQHTVVIDPAVTATGTMMGKTEGKHCSVCGEVLIPQKIIYVKGFGGLQYELNEDGKSYSVTGIGTCTDSDVVIPDIYDKLPVTGIAKSAFFNCTSLTSIAIPNSVTSVGHMAFAGCMNLIGVYITDLVAWCKINFNSDAASPLYGSDLYLNGTLVKELVIPDGVTGIGESAFEGCTSLTSIKIGNGVTSIGDGAFNSCIKLVSIEVDVKNTVYHSAGNCLIESATKTLILGCKTSIIPTDGSVTSIGEYAFGDCEGLKSIAIPDSVINIGDDAFGGCENLRSIAIPDSVKSIGDYAFSGCTNLTEVAIGSGVRSIGYATFDYCVMLASIKVDVKNAKYHSAGNCLIETATKTLVLGCKKSIIPTDGSVTCIGYAAFESCTGLTSIAIPDCITDIEEWAFGGCTELTNITFQGTKAQWNQISKGDFWDFKISNYTIRCTDGTIAG